MNREHKYNLSTQWEGNTGKGTCGYSAYERDYTISYENKNPVSCLSDPAFRSNNAKYNPEELNEYCFIANL